MYVCHYNCEFEQNFDPSLVQIANFTLSITFVICWSDADASFVGFSAVYYVKMVLDGTMYFLKIDTGSPHTWLKCDFPDSKTKTTKVMFYIFKHQEYYKIHF